VIRYRPRLWLSPLIGAYLLTGCSHEAELYRRPDTPIAENWPPSATIVGSRQVKDIRWQDFFSDPRLRMLIATAMDKNRDLRIALARIAETRAQLGVVQADKLPSANLSGNMMNTRIPANLTGTNTPTTSRRNELAIGTVSYEIDFWGRVASINEAALASFLASEEARKALRISLISEIANTYFTLLELEQRIALTREVVETRRQGYDLMQQGFRYGAAARSEMLLAESLLETAQAELAMIEHQRALAEHSLTVLTGDTGKSLPAGKRLHEQDVSNDLAAGLPSEVLLARPDIAAAEQRLKEAHANLNAARTAFLPKILLTASLGLASRGLTGLFATDSGNWLFQPSLSQPLFDGGRTAGMVDMAVARKNSAVADYEKAIQQAFREVADLLAVRASLAKQRKATEAAARAQAERFVVADARFKAGSISRIDVLDAKRELLAARQGLIQIQRSQLSAAAQLYKALGGGNNDDENLNQK
jgi:multidrug efflux system outer membrane protein